MIESGQPLTGLALYNPHLQSKEESVEYFFARKPLLDRLLADLRATGPASSVQPHLLIGQRGMGKTTLLRRLRYAIEDDAELDGAWIALTFPEEQYNIASLGDFWLNCLDALGDELERRGEQTEVARLDSEEGALRSVARDRKGGQALKALVAAARRLGRRLILLVDNADLLFERIAESEEWSLREVLSTERSIAFYSASASAIESTFHYGKAFYDFFQIHELQGLTIEETRGLLAHYAEIQERPEVKRIVESEGGRIKTLHTLTGGNPRTLALLYNLLARGTSRDIRTDLEQLLDQSTPLYKARFESLAVQGQQVVHALSIHWNPISAGELAEELGWEVNAASAQLNRLVKQGVVEKVPYFPAHKTGFQIGERFFNIWYLMRASRRVRRRLIWLVEFLKLFYSQEQLNAQALSHLRSSRNSVGGESLREVEESFAFAEALAEPSLRSAMEIHGLRLLIAHQDRHARLSDLLALEGSDAHLKDRAQYLRHLEEVKRQVFTARPKSKKWNAEKFWEKLGEAVLLIEEKAAIAAEIQSVSPKKLAKIQARLDGSGATKLAGACDDLDLGLALGIALREGYMVSPRDVEGARSAEHILAFRGLVELAMFMAPREDSDAAMFDRLSELARNAQRPWILLLWLVAAYDRGALDEISLRRAAEQALALEAPSAELLTLLAWLVQDSVDEGSLAESLLRKSIELMPENPATWARLGWLLRARPGSRAEAELALRRAVALDPDSSLFAGGLGRFLFEETDRLGEAELWLRKSIGLELDPSLGILLARALMQKGEWREALDVFCEVVVAVDAWTRMTLEQAILFLSSMQSSDKSEDVISTIGNTNELRERLLPLMAAMEAGDRTALARWAPEIRRPAEEIFDLLEAACSR